MKIKTSTGIVLDDEYGLCKSLNDYAINKGLENIRIFFTGYSYLIVNGTLPVFESQKAEDIAVHLDMMKLSESLDE